MGLSDSFFGRKFGLTEHDLAGYLSESLSRGGDYADLYFEYVATSSLGIDESIVKSATEGVTIEFGPDAIKRIAEIAFAVNERAENIGARRLYTVMEKLLEHESFDAVNHGGRTIAIDAAYVDHKLAGIVKDENLSQFIL